MISLLIIKTAITCMTPHDYDVFFDITVRDDYSHKSSIVTNKSTYCRCFA